MSDYTLSDIRTAIRLADDTNLKKERLLARLPKSLGEGQELFPFHLLPPSIRWNVCRVKLSRGCWDWLGWELRSDYAEKFRRLAPNKWDGKAEGRVYVIGEEGVGDEIMVASCFNELPPCTIECDPRLKGHFERSFPQHVFRERLRDGENREGYDWYIPLMDLLPIYRKSPKDCPGTPYLKPDPERVAYWRETLPVGIFQQIHTPTTGIAWISRHGKQRPFFLPGVSLQYGEHKSPEWLFVPDIDPIADFGDQINLIAALDRVVSGPMSVVHAAGALGIETHVIMPAFGTGDVHNALHWRYECGLPFYNSAKVHRNWIEARKCVS